MTWGGCWGATGWCSGGVKGAVVLQREQMCACRNVSGSVAAGGGKEAVVLQRGKCVHVAHAEITVSVLLQGLVRGSIHTC